MCPVRREGAFIDGVHCLPALTDPRVSLPVLRELRLFLSPVGHPGSDGCIEPLGSCRGRNSPLPLIASLRLERWLGSVLRSRLHAMCLPARK
jgi:hypothetical protein